MFDTIGEFAELGPDYTSVTYGAAGSTSRSTLDTVKKIQERFGITCMHHFTLMNQTAAELTRHCELMMEAGVKNVLALICWDVHKISAPVARDIEETVRRGTRYNVEQSEDLMKRGAPGIHFYSLNKTEPVRTIWKYLRDEIEELASQMAEK